MSHRTIEDRLGEIETGVHELKALLIKYIAAKPEASINKSDESLMSVKDVARFAGVETSMIYAACNKGQIQFIKIGKLYKFKKSAILEWINGERQQQNDKIDVNAYVENYLQQHRRHS